MNDTIKLKAKEESPNTQAIYPLINGDKDGCKALNKALYNAARNLVVPRFRDDADDIKQVRDGIVWDLFQKNYKDCMPEELEVAIEYCNWKKKGTPVRATQSQIKLLRYYQFYCAVVYCNFEQLMWKDEDGKIKSGNDVKTIVVNSLSQNIRIPSNIFRWMYETWINPTSHKFMIEGDLKKYAKNKAIFHYEYLRPEEANYLIQRFSQMFLALSNGGKINIELFGEGLN